MKYIILIILIPKVAIRNFPPGPFAYTSSADCVSRVILGMEIRKVGRKEAGELAAYSRLRGVSTWPQPTLAQAASNDHGTRITVLGLPELLDAAICLPRFQFGNRPFRKFTLKLRFHLPC